MKKKRRFFAWVLAGIVIIGVALLLAWPLSFANRICDNASLNVLMLIHVERVEGITVEDGRLIDEYGNIIETSRVYRFENDSEEFMQIREIVARYSFRRYHRTLPGFLRGIFNPRGGGTFQLPEHDYNLNLYFNCPAAGGHGVTEIRSWGTGEIIVARNHHRGQRWRWYRMNPGAERAMRAEIMSILDAQYQTE
ncbi:MAG: hypothetical protein FWC96_06665 [Oscillospiraceae bacterium]|nr:hypothetical protein [Oscillospiraceae bacterium]